MDNKKRIFVVPLHRLSRELRTIPKVYQGYKRSWHERSFSLEDASLQFRGDKNSKAFLIITK